MWLRIVLLLLIQGPLTRAVTLMAQISSGGVMGSVTFDQTTPGQQVSLNFSLSGPNSGEASSVQFREHRVKYDMMNRCDNLGDRFLDAVSIGVSDATVSGVELTGANSIEGLSIVILKADSSVLACANVENQANYVTASATFRRKVLGRVTLRQQASDPSALTRLTLDLEWDGSRSGSKALQWRIVPGRDVCGEVASAYDPKGASGSCGQATQMNCAVGDLSGKHGPVTVEGGMATMGDLNLPLSGDHSALDNTLQLIDPAYPNTPLACATVLAYMARTGKATFDSEGVTGTVTLTQPSPFDPTMSVVALSGLGSQASEYGVHELPVPQRVSRAQMLCSKASVWGIFKPHGVDYAGSPPAADGTSDDMYQVGDLGRKHGLLDGLDTKSETYTDMNLPLFGTNSVLGRSLVINNASGDPWACATIHDPMALTSVLATFTFPVIGHVLMQQHQGHPEEDTTVYYRLDYGDGVTEPSQGHAWDLHDESAGADMLDDDAAQRCVSAGDVMNPFNVAETNYDSQCSSSTPLRCKAGDLTSRLGSVSVRSSMGPAVGFFIDVNLPLPDIMGKSLVLKFAGGGSENLACATLEKVHPLVAVGSDWGEGGSPDYGSVTFTQGVGVVQGPTTVDVNLQGLSQHTSVAYKVHTGRCKMPGDVYNPFQVSSTMSTKDDRPMGDLSGKFGSLAGADPTGSNVDPSLDVWGPFSVLGRSLKLTSQDGATVGCSDIAPKEAAGGMLFQAEAVFMGQVEGKITMTQYMPTKDAAMMPTTVVVDLRKTQGAQTMRHNWHTHKLVVGEELPGAAQPCLSTSGHYNPFKVNVQSNYSECGPSNPMRCELGDQSKKLGTLSMGTGATVADDVFLPLFGPYTVVGRSIVVHVPEKGAPRMVCADIYPVGTSNSMTMTVKPPAFDRAQMIQAIASAMNIEPYDLTVKMLSKNEKCVHTRVYFLGMEASSHVNTFTSISTSSDLGDYKSRKDDECPTGKAGMALVSVCLLLASLLLGRLLV